MTLSWILIVLTLFGYGLASLIPWGFAALVCVISLVGFPLLVRVVHPWGAKSLNARY